MARTLAVLCLSVPLAGLLACDAASTEQATTMLLRVESAQLVPGLPTEFADDGPRVRGLSLMATRVEPGQRDKPLGGTLDAGAGAAVIYLLGDRAHYILPAGAADLTAPGQPTFAARLSFAAWLPLGQQTLAVHAVDAAGHPGPPLLQALQAVPDLSAPSPPASEPPELAIVLAWSRPADLDLHVVEPDGRVVWSRRKGGTGAAVTSGVLDWDSNGGCVLDGWNRETVTYATPPRPGTYRVLVDTPSLCGQPTAYYSVAIYRRGKPISGAAGQSLPSDTRGEHGALSGTLALELRWP